MTTKTYDVRKQVGAVRDFLSKLSKVDQENVAAEMKVANLKLDDLMKLPVWFNGKTSKRAGAFHVQVVRSSNAVLYRALGLRAPRNRSKPISVTPIRIELHPSLFDKDHPERKDQARETLLHEIAHYIAELAYKDTGHGLAWKRTMRRLGLHPHTSHDLPYVTSDRKQSIYECMTCGKEFRTGRALKNGGATKYHPMCRHQAPHHGKLSLKGTTK